MALNLDSLKNLSQTSTHPNISEKDVATPVPAPVPVVSEVAPSAQEKAPSTGPKISLMKLKQSTVSATEVAPKPVEAAPISDTLSVAEIEKWFSSLATKKEEESAVEDTTLETITQEEQKEEVISILPEVVETTTPVVSETQSLVIDMGEASIQEETEETEEIDTTPKELFPNLQISNAMSLDEDLLDLRGIISTDEQEQVVAEKEETIEITQAEAVTPVYIPENESEVVTPIENVQETISTPEVSEIIATSTETPAAIADITPEYVAEVKTELSEQRRAGFRFFVKNKTKILAGMGIVFSLSVVAIFSGSLVTKDVQKTGKANVQEEVKNTEVINTDAQNTTDTGADITSVTEPAGYAVGRDYSVTKNTKKNVRSKSASGSATMTATGADIPTP